MDTGSADVIHVRYMVVHEVKAVKVQHGPKEAGSAHMYRVSGSGVTRKVLLRYNTSTVDDSAATYGFWRRTISELIKSAGQSASTIIEHYCLVPLQCANGLLVEHM
jgi:hypothetical protein